MDYSYLNDLFEDDLEEQNQSITDPLYELKSLKEARELDEWEQWDAAVKAELDQLVKMGTWILVDKPEDAIPILNKYVFKKKTNKAGEVVCHKED